MPPAKASSLEPLENKNLHRILKKLLHQASFGQRGQAPLQLLDIACGECREAETLVKVARELRGENNRQPIRFVGTDLRDREVEDAARRFRSTQDTTYDFITENAEHLDRHQELGKDFDLALIRHQNFWLGATPWKRIFEQGLGKLSDDGLLVITSYFDREHALALDAIAEAGGELLVTERHQESIHLAQPGKSVDRHVAVFRKKS